MKKVPIARCKILVAFVLRSGYVKKAPKTHALIDEKCQNKIKIASYSLYP
jgi:hypothetical protein